MKEIFIGIIAAAAVLGSFCLCEILANIIPVQFLLVLFVIGFSTFIGVNLGKVLMEEDDQ